MKYAQLGTSGPTVSRMAPGHQPATNTARYHAPNVGAQATDRALIDVSARTGASSRSYPIPSAYH